MRRLKRKSRQQREQGLKRKSRHLDDHQVFCVCRKNDVNLVACLSDKNEEVQVYIDSEFSALNSMHPVNAERFNISHIKKKNYKNSNFFRSYKRQF